MDLRMKPQSSHRPFRPNFQDFFLLGGFLGEGDDPQLSAKALYGSTFPGFSYIGPDPITLALFRHVEESEQFLRHFSRPAASATSDMVTEVLAAARRPVIRSDTDADLSPGSFVWLS
jgi:hypothetical protein